jgi:hypothetical protein
VSEPALIVGIDCAVRAEHTGICSAEYAPGNEGALTLLSCETGRRGRGSGSEYGPAEQAAAAASGALERGRRVLLALDAPLGWPERMGPELSGHRAGRPIWVPANTLFRRRTDVKIKELLGKNPLDVGADRIARTALAALGLIGACERMLGTSIEPAEGPDFGARIASAEVYPAGTLVSHGLLRGLEGSRKSGDNPAALLGRLSGRFSIRNPGLVDETNEHLMDALLCVCTAKDFLDGAAVAPQGTEELRLAAKEGWIWVRDPEYGESRIRG